MKERNKLLNKVRMYNFAIIEANLFLDTHPENKDALMYLKKVNELYEKAKSEFVARYGPLKVTDVTENFDWVKGPWPWEVEANVEL